MNLPLLYTAVYVATAVVLIWTFVAVTERGTWLRILKQIRRRFS